MRICHSHNAERTRARLISTPTKGTAMSTTIEGVKFSDQLAALLDHARANGFRLEADNRRGKASGVKCYPPNTELAPFVVSEERAKFNPAHYDNIRRQFYRAGCPVLPGDKRAAEDVTGPGVLLANSKDEALALAPEGASVTELPGGIGMVDDNGGDLVKILRDDESGPAFIGQVVLGLMAQAGAAEPEQHLVAAITKTAATWVADFGRASLDEAVNAAAHKVRSSLMAEVNEALRMASEHEATAARATKALERSQAAEQKARDDCKAALARAEAAEKQAAELEAAIRPLRNLLGTPS